MYRIVTKRPLNATVTLMEVEAPMVAKKAEPGQFIILRVDDEGERIPLTIAGYDREKGTVTIIFQVVGATTVKLNAKAEGEYLQDFVGPLGNATETEGLKKVAVVGGGVGCAIAYPVACSDVLKVMTDDGTYGEKGLVTDALDALVNAGNQYDEVIAIGPLVMMKFVTLTAKKHNLPIVVSMSPIMVDGTGMCGGCRLTVGGETKFACVDGPDFDGYKVDFDEAISRGAIYKDFERHAYEEACNLFQKEVK